MIYVPVAQGTPAYISNVRAGEEWSNESENYAGGNVATGRASLAGQTSTWEVTNILTHSYLSFIPSALSSMKLLPCRLEDEPSKAKGDTSESEN